MESGADSGAGVDGGPGADSNGEFLRCFGRQMKLLREAAGLTQAQLGERVGYGEAQIAAVEQGRRIPRPELVDAVDREVGGRGLLVLTRSTSDSSRSVRPVSTAAWNSSAGCPPTPRRTRRTTGMAAVRSAATALSYCPRNASGGTPARGPRPEIVLEHAGLRLEILQLTHGPHGPPPSPRARTTPIPVKGRFPPKRLRGRAHGAIIREPQSLGAGVRWGDVDGCSLPRTGGMGWHGRGRWARARVCCCPCSA